VPLTKSQPTSVVSPEPSTAERPSPPPAEVLVELVYRELRASPYPDMRRLTCRLQEGQLVLQGRVRSFFLKQMAQVMAVRLATTLVVDNQVEVVSERI